MCLPPALASSYCSNEALRVAYVDEVELDRLDSENARWGPPSKAYYSVLVKASQGEEQEVYRIRLPGNPKLGEGKPENQNHAIIFTRGDALQAIDMNQASGLHGKVYGRVGYASRQ